MQIDQVYCENDYWYDYPRKDRVKINETCLDNNEMKRLREGETISKPDRGGSYTQRFIPIRYDSIRS